MGLGKYFARQNLNKKAQDAFMRAYMLEGKDLFEKDSNQQYFEIISKYC